MSAPGSRAANKLEEQATAKADLSYSYWTSGNKPANTELTPKKLTPEEAGVAGQKGIEQGASASAWNQAGTFEERCVTEWARACLDKHLKGARCGRVEVTAVTSITGDANIWFIRGKKRHGFEFDISLSWQAASSSGSGEALQGTVKLPTASPDDLDDLHMEVQLTNKGGADAAEQEAVLREAKQIKDALAAALEKFYAELKQL